MPLILVTGLPSSGKSVCAENIQKYFESYEGNTKKTRIVSDTDNLDWDGRDTIYSSIPKEKELRSWLKAEAQRYMSLNQIVILDAASYIKGYRYELFCISKEAKTQYAVVELLIDSATCWERNQNRDNGYSRQAFDALVARYEKCDDSNRWDSPLFRITSENDQLDLEKLYNSITKEEPLVPNKCTSFSSTNSTIFKPNT